MSLQVRKDEVRSRYELVEDGDAVIGVAEYRVQGDLVVFDHTVIDEDRRAQGLAAVLVQGALDDVRLAGRKVVPVCWYVGQFMDTHSGYADLAA
ncbi:MAG: GNAT family N-acetyltransferase [Acidimicrobiales bacterium]